MPEDKKTEVESNGKIVKEIYIDREVVDKFWIEDPRGYYGIPEKGMLGTLILNDCCDERVILLMGSDCGTDDLMMEGEVFSEGSDGISFDYEPMTRSMVLRENLNGGDFDGKLLGGKDHEEEKKFAEKSEMTSTMEASTIGEPKSQEGGKPHDLEPEDVIALGRAVQGSRNGHHQRSGSLPYSGSVSIRSTSSTASAQSFAFPVLAEEWNSSPVRMAKPDDMQLRKQKGWIWKMKVAWFCCRF